MKEEMLRMALDDACMAYGKLFNENAAHLGEIDDLREQLAKYKNALMVSQNELRERDALLARAAELLAEVAVDSFKDWRIWFAKRDQLLKDASMTGHER
jgi:chromosome condensin MukBEF ATPase and DNA-binding subunit MukB